MEGRQRKRILMPDKHMGNLVVSIPAIRALCEFYRDHMIFLLVDSAYRELVETIEGVDTMIIYPRSQIQNQSIINRSVEFLKFILSLRKIKPDIAIDLEGRELSSTLTFLSGAPLRMGSINSRRTVFYNKKLYIPPQNSHRVYKYMDIARAIGCKVEKISYFLKATDARRLSLKDKLNRYSINADMPIVCIHPGAGRFFREWHSEGFAEVADYLSANDYQVVFVGGNGDLGKIHEVISLMKYPSYNLGGKLTLGELIALFELASLYIGNDTGPLHIASAIKTLPVVGLYFRPGADKTWYPFTRRSVILKGDIGCHKCKGRHCEHDFECIRRLTPHEVKTAVERLLNRG